ncbi:cystatin-B-like [Xenia sp. Carnegie-2017]|uniref:cystatin-B-like n=1 Tax=Xenia sp. Carnegie-2017 TaxID=2897299 RepID=UPI001F03668E|nr:cystatin-B-like [Xenia sp. Carnegie-2017]
MSIFLGDHGTFQKAGPEMQDRIEKVKEAAEKKHCQKFDMYEADMYSSHAVSGTLYYVKVKIDPDHFVLLQVYEPHGIVQHYEKNAPELTLVDKFKM